MLEIQKEAIENIWDNPYIRNIEDGILDMGVRNIGRYPYFLDSENSLKYDGLGFKVDEKDVARLLKCLGWCMDGIGSIDSMIMELKCIRGCLVKDALMLRQAYRPSEFRSEIMRLHQLSVTWNDNRGKCDKEVSDILAKILGFGDMPEWNECAINFNLFNDAAHDSVRVVFSVKGKPTSIEMSLPVEVDYRCRNGIPYGDEGYSGYPSEAIDGKIPRIVLCVYLGAVAQSGEFCVDTTDRVSAVCPDLKTLSEKVKKAMGFDVREKMKKIASIRDVNTVDDFVYWRGLRAANNSAIRNEGSQM
jgi:hypothetical protein